MTLTVLLPDITLDYQLSPFWDAKRTHPDLATAGEMSLRYEVLLGDVILKAKQHDFSAKWGWIPVVDFAASLRHIVRELSVRDGVQTTFDFTESDAVLRFKRAGDEILISASYAPGEAHVPLREFSAAVESFSRRVASELPQQYPLLRSNKSFQHLFSIPENANENG